MDLKLLKKKNQSEETDNCRLRQKWKFWKKKLSTVIVNDLNI